MGTPLLQQIMLRDNGIPRKFGKLENYETCVFEFTGFLGDILDLGQ
jgi:hypothetical protein